MKKAKEIDIQNRNTVALMRGYGYSIAQIADELWCSIYEVRQHLKALGLK